MQAQKRVDEVNCCRQTIVLNMHPYHTVWYLNITWTLSRGFETEGYHVRGIIILIIIIIAPVHDTMNLINYFAILFLLWVCVCVLFWVVIAFRLFTLQSWFFFFKNKKLIHLLICDKGGSLQNKYYNILYFYINRIRVFRINWLTRTYVYTN